MTDLGYEQELEAQDEQDKAMAELSEFAFQNEYLDHFNYYDWDTGNDDKLRIGDKLDILFEEPTTGSQIINEGEIVIHPVNGIPVFLVNDDDYLDIQSVYMGGGMLKRTVSLVKRVK